MLLVLPIRFVPRLWSHPPSSFGDGVDGSGIDAGVRPAKSGRYRMLGVSSAGAGGTVGRGARSARSQAGAAAESTIEGAGEAPSTVDPNDLHAMVVEHGDAVYRLALSVVRDPSLAEDVAQEALVKAWQALPNFRGDASLRSWLLRITHNTAISVLRSRRAVVIDPYDLPEQEQIPERSVEARVQSGAVMEEFAAALNTLDELSRSIVVLRELEGLTYEEIVDVLGVPMPTVKTRLLRARRQLGNVLREWA